MKANLTIYYSYNRLVDTISYEVYPTHSSIQCCPSSIWVSIAKYYLQFNTTLNKKKVIKYLTNAFKKYNIELGDVIFEKQYEIVSDYKIKQGLKTHIDWIKHQRDYLEEFKKAHEYEK